MPVQSLTTSSSRLRVRLALRCGLWGMMVNGCDASHAQREAPSGQVSVARTILDLQEQDVLPALPFDEVVGGTFLPNGRIAYWTQTAVRLIDPGRSTARDLCGNIDSPRAVAFNPTSHFLEVLDRKGVLRSSEDGCVRGVSVRKTRVITSGVMSRGGWIWMEGDSAGPPSIWSEDSKDGGPLAHLLTEIQDIKRANTRLAPSNSERFVMISTTSPYSWSAIADGMVVASGRPPARSLDTTLGAVWSGGVPQARWITTGFVDLQSAFLQVIADVTTNRRLLFLFDSTGTYVRHSVVDYPFGVLAADPGRNLLLAVRRPDSLELVLYSWKWRVP